jgi:hypothetical protein
MHAIGRSRCAGLTGAGDWTVAQVEDSLGAGDSVAEAGDSLVALADLTPWDSLRARDWAVALAEDSLRLGIRHASRSRGIPM